MMTPSQIEIAEQALKGAREAIKAGKLYANGVQIKSVHRGNVKAVFPPGVREVVQRYLCGVTH